MVDGGHVEILCKTCGKPVEQVPGKRKREFCNDTCRQRHHRLKLKQHQTEEAQANTDALLSELEQLRTQVREQAQEIARLERLLDVEKYYLSDRKKRTFKPWLRKQPPSPFIEKLLADQFFPVQGTRAHYQAHLNSMQCTEAEKAEFEDLWKLMLLSR